MKVMARSSRLAVKGAAEARASAVAYASWPSYVPLCVHSDVGSRVQRQRRGVGRDCGKHEGMQL